MCLCTRTLTLAGCVLLLLLVSHQVAGQACPQPGPTAGVPPQSGVCGRVLQGTVAESWTRVLRCYFWPWLECVRADTALLPVGSADNPSFLPWLSGTAAVGRVSSALPQ